MKRREFITSSVVGIASATVASAEYLADRQKQKTSQVQAPEGLSRSEPVYARGAPAFPYQSTC